MIWLFIGAWQATLNVGGGTLEVKSDASVPKAIVLAWIEQSAKTVSLYYGHFPVAKVTLTLQASERLSGRTFGDPAHIDLDVPPEIDAEALHEDWVLVHEMIHLALPSQVRQHTWLEEGISTFVEPVARARAGQRAADRVWIEWLTSMAQGEPAAGDQGLDHTHTWARTYWGGALFCLVAEVRLRVATHGGKGLDTALRGVQAAGGSINVEWPIERVLAAGDAATGTHVLQTLYAESKAAPAPVDLPALWVALGVSLHEGKIVFDDQAKWAAERKAILPP